MNKITHMTINGFKSIVDNDIDLRSLNVLIGPNGSGKTNFLEFFKYLKETLGTSSIPSYPFASWGGYRNIAHNFNTEKAMEIKIQGVVDDTNYTYMSKAIITNEIPHYIYEKLEINDVCNITRQHSEFTIVYPQKLISKLRQNFKKMRPEMDKKIMKLLQNSGSQETSIDTNNSILNYMHTSSYASSNNLTHGLINNKIAFVSEIVHNPNSISDPKFIKCLDSLRFNGVILLRSICNVRETSYPGLIGLDEDGRGLVNVLYSYRREHGTLPSSIISAMRELFPKWQIDFQLSNNGIITLIGRYDNLEFLPNSLPDGLFKLLLILTALEMRPQILLIDEIENSLHINIIKYILDECERNENTTVFCTSHSPQIMDLVRLENIILVKHKNQHSIYSHVKSLDSLKKQLIDTDMTFSDIYFDGNL